MSANDRQVGGNHYKQHGATGEEHWDRQWRLYGRGYFVGCITKYVERYHDKNGVQDLEKAKHYIEKLIELEAAAVAGSVVVRDYEAEQSTRDSRALYGWRCPHCASVITTSQALHELKTLKFFCPDCNGTQAAPVRPWACTSDNTDHVPANIVGTPL